MRAVVQRVLRARVVIDGGTGRRDRAPGCSSFWASRMLTRRSKRQWLAEKIAGLRIFNDADGKMNRDLVEIGGAMLIVSQFTLYGECRKGKRPSFIDAAPPPIAIPLYEDFINGVKALGVPVATGRFGADMQVELVNDGPVTLIVDSK